MIVVDTNVITYLWFPSPYTVQAEELFIHDPNWLAPPFWKSEFRNVVSQYIRKGVDFGSALELLSLAEQHMQENEVAVESDEVMELVRRSGCTAYDCEFVAVAFKKSLPLVTYDKQIRQNFPDIAFTVEDYLNRKNQ